MADITEFPITPNDGGLGDSLNTLNMQTRDLERGAAGFARAMTQAFTRAAVDGKKFEDVLKSLVLRLSDMSLRMAFKPLERGLASGLEGLFKGLGGAGSAAQPFAAGGVIGTPTYFPLGARGLGVAGEAGAEAILPLARGADGTLGVAAQGSGGGASVTVHISTPDADSFRRSEAYVSGQIARAVARGQRVL